jgi:hypothetical protein
MSDPSKIQPSYHKPDSRNKARLERGSHAGDRINELYLNSLSGVPRMRQNLKLIQDEVREHGFNTLQKLDHEIQMCIWLCSETMNALSTLPTDIPQETYERRAKSLRYELDTHLATLTKMKEVNHAMHYGPKFGVRIDEVENLMKFVMQVILHRVRDPDSLKKIARDFEDISSANFKTDVMRGAREIEVKHESSREMDMGEDAETPVADDSGAGLAGGPSGDAGV